MKSYIGVKSVEAEPMNLADFKLDVKGEGMVPAEDEKQEGYLVVYPDGYKSWSPKDVFEKAYFEAAEGKTYQEIADRLCQTIVAVRVGRRTLSGSLICLNGFEVSASVMARDEADLDANYNDYLIELTKKANAKLLEHVRFVVMLASNGLDQNVYEKAFNSMNQQSA